MLGTGDGEPRVRKPRADGTIRPVRRAAPALAADHTPQAIARRLAEERRSSLLGDALLGAIDGSVTTFALVAGALGAGFAPRVALVLGLANLFADGISMALGNYERARTDRDLRERVRAVEERHVDEVPEGEREEVRQIFARFGLSGATLEDVVATVTSDRERWVETMVVLEHGLADDARAPWSNALATLAAFVTVGSLPLLPLLLAPGREPAALFAASTAATAVAFAATGAARGALLGRSPLVAALQTLALGGVASACAWAVGSWFGAA